MLARDEPALAARLVAFRAQLDVKVRALTLPDLS
jgi:hypothetical protein